MSIWVALIVVGSLSLSLIALMVAAHAAEEASMAAHRAQSVLDALFAHEGKRRGEGGHF